MPSFRIPQSVVDQVAADGQPRTVDAREFDDIGQPTDNTRRETIFRDGAKVRSAPEADAPALIAAIAQAAADAAALRTRILNLAQSAVGVSIDLLTAGQRNALIACLLYENGAIDKDGVVKPLGQWL